MHSKKNSSKQPSNPPKDAVNATGSYSMQSDSFVDNNKSESASSKDMVQIAQNAQKT